jgi:uncharacterized protein YabE (DUF348 family)
MQSYTSPRRFLGDSRLILWCLGVVVAAGLVLTGFFYNRHEIRIFSDGKQTQLIIRGGTVAEALNRAQIALSEKDIVVPSLETKIAGDVSIEVTRMLRVTLTADGNTDEYWVLPGTVGQTLTKLNVSLNSGDQVIPDSTKPLKSGDEIEVVRFSSHYVNESVKIPFRVENRNDGSMERGVTSIVQQGKEGLSQKTIKITLRNGKEVSREIVGEKTMRQPVNKIVAVGTVRTKVISRDGTIKFSKSLQVSASAYTHTGRNTASGIYPYKGAVAVDPRVIPMGTNLYIEGYGYAKALDIGSAIKGNKIDLFFETESQAIRWGRRPVKVYILE